MLKAIFTGPIQFVKNLIGAAIWVRELRQELPHAPEGRGVRVADRLARGHEAAVDLGPQGHRQRRAPDGRLSLTNIREALVDGDRRARGRGLETTFTLVKTLITEGPDGGLGADQGHGRRHARGVRRRRDGLHQDEDRRGGDQDDPRLLIPGAGIDPGRHRHLRHHRLLHQEGEADRPDGRQLPRAPSREIAAGNIGAAADALENGLARGLKLVISFLARFCG